MVGRGSRCAVLGMIVIPAVVLGTVAPPAHADAPDDPNDADALAASRRLSPRSDVVFVSLSDINADELGSRDVRVSAGLPIVRGDDYGFGVVPRYTATWVDPDVPGGRDLMLHRFDLLAGGGGRVAPGWWLRGGVGVTYASDLAGTSGSSQALQATASATVRHATGDSDAWILGVLYTSSSDLVPVLPVVGYVHQRPGSPVRVDALLPHHARVGYAFAPAWQGALGVEVFHDLWISHAMVAPFAARRDGGALYAELDVAVGRVHFEWRTGLALMRYVLPGPATDDNHPDGLGPCVFAQLLAVAPP